MIIVDDFPNDEQIRNMSDNKLLECYKKWVILHDSLLLDRDEYASDKLYDEQVMSDQNVERRKNHREKYKSYSNLLSKKIRLSKEVIDKRRLEVKWWEDSSDDPLYNWYFQRMGKQDLIRIIDDLNKEKGSIAKQLGINLESKLKLSGTIPELRRRTMDYIPKNKRKEYFIKILSELRKQELK